MQMARSRRAGTARQFVHGNGSASRRIRSRRGDTSRGPAGTARGCRAVAPAAGSAAGEALHDRGQAVDIVEHHAADPEPLAQSDDLVHQCVDRADEDVWRLEELGGGDLEIGRPHWHVRRGRAASRSAWSVTMTPGSSTDTC